MFPEDQGPAETAIGFTDQFVEAGVAKLDALFGAGYAKANPQALGRLHRRLREQPQRLHDGGDGDRSTTMRPRRGARRLRGADSTPTPPPKPKGRRR